MHRFAFLYEQKKEIANKNRSRPQKFLSKTKKD